MPFSIIRAIAVVLYTQTEKLGWIHVAHWLNALQISIFAFIPLLVNAFYSVHWAIRSRTSIVQAVTMSLVGLLIVTGLTSTENYFFLDVSLPVALLVSIFTNLSMDFIVSSRNNKGAISEHSKYIYSLPAIACGISLSLLVCIPLLLLSEKLASHLSLYIYPDSFIHGMLYELVRGSAWFFGIHGQYLFQVIGFKFLNESTANMLAWQQGHAQLNILSTTFFDTWCSAGGCGSTLSLVICLLIRRNHSYRRLTKLSLPLALFNINEPIIFGIPIVLNPIMLVPFILTPQVNFIIAYFATLWGFVPKMQQLVSWVTPPVLDVWMGSGGSINAVILHVLIISLGVIIYQPFIIYMERRSNNYITLPGGANVKVNLAKETATGTNPIDLDFSPTYNHLSQANEHFVAKRKVQELQSSGEFVLYFQPQVRLGDRKIVGLEVLVRHQSHKGKITPPIFLRYYEQLGMMAEMDFWVFENSIMHIHQHMSHFEDMVMAINISPQTLTDYRLFNVIDSVLEKPLPGGWKIEFEITESQKVLDPKKTKEVLEKLHQRGIAVALDDFGAGYSSISYLLSYKLDKIKLDRSLVQGMAEEGGVDFFNQVVRLCQSRQYRVLMEGIETEEEYQRGCEAGIPLGQGYFFHRPLSRDAVCQVLSAQNNPNELDIY